MALGSADLKARMVEGSIDSIAKYIVTQKFPDSFDRSKRGVHEVVDMRVREPMVDEYFTSGVVILHCERGGTGMTNFKSGTIRIGKDGKIAELNNREFFANLDEEREAVLVEIARAYIEKMKPMMEERDRVRERLDKAVKELLTTSSPTPESQE